MMTLAFLFGSSSDSPSASEGQVVGSEKGSSHAGSRARESSQNILATRATELFSRIQQHNDEHAFIELMSSYRAPLKQFALNYVDQPDDANDIVDDVFVWIWEHRTTIVLSGSIRSYLYGAVRHRALNARRNAEYRRAWSKRHADRPAEAAMGAHGQDIVSEVERQELGVLLREAIDQLATGRRTVVRLRWIEEMSYAEIASVMDTSVIAVKRQLNRALQDLRTLLPTHLK